MSKLEPVQYRQNPQRVDARRTSLFPGHVEQRGPRLVDGSPPPDPQGFDPPKLTPGEWLFCHEYLLDMNPAAAALRAGYKDGRHGAKLMQEDRIQAGIHLANAKRLASVRVDAEWVLAECVDTYVTCKSQGLVDGRIRILKLLMEHLGMLQKRVEHTGQIHVLHGPDPHRMNLRELTDAELDMLDGVSHKIYDHPPALPEPA